jgi:hypothetical protein
LAETAAAYAGRAAFAASAEWWRQSGNYGCINNWGAVAAAAALSPVGDFADNVAAAIRSPLFNGDAGAAVSSFITDTVVGLFGMAVAPPNFQ